MQERPLIIRLVRCYLFSVVLYGVEAWILKAVSVQRIEPFKIWMYRCFVENIMYRVAYPEVLRKFNKGKELKELNVKVRKKCSIWDLRADRYNFLRLII